jgi:hypothetical protein
MRFACLVASCVILASASAVADEISVERGRLVSIIGGCNDCHTVGYTQSDGVIDPAAALKGSPVGFQGPWGTTYPMNLRITAATLSEDGFVGYMQAFDSLPPMPWFNVRAIPESDLRSLYRYIKSLGEPGEQVPAALPPGATPRTPYIVFVPQMPPPCSRDLDCGVGEICSPGEPRMCVKK